MIKMEIMVCVKQVPDTEMIKVDPVTGSLVREGVPSITNPYDLNAAEAALQIRDACGGRVTAVCMGPLQAKESLIQCLSMGADRAVLISDRVFKDSDTLATSYVLSLAAKQFGPFDLILCGQQSLDGETGQVGPQIAEFLDWNQITCAEKIDVTENGLVIDRDLGYGVETVLTPLPIVCTVTKKLCEPRRPTMKGKLAAKKASVAEINAQTLENLDSERVGIKGSPTSVVKSFAPPVGEPGLMIKDLSPAEAAQRLVDLLVRQEAISV
jgi:electron transfer flavoprotein beta subunit